MNLLPDAFGCVRIDITHGGKFFVQIRPTFNNFLTFYPYKLKFEKLLDTFKIQNLAVLVCQHFIFLAGK